MLNIRDNQRKQSSWFIERRIIVCRKSASESSRENDDNQITFIIQCDMFPLVIYCSTSHLAGKRKLSFNYLESTNISRWQRTVKAFPSSCYKCCTDSDKDSDSNLEAFFTKCPNSPCYTHFVSFFSIPILTQFPPEISKGTFKASLKIGGNVEERSTVHLILKLQKFIPYTPKKLCGKEASTSSARMISEFTA